jgi:hypothetical protein
MYLSTVVVFIMDLKIKLYSNYSDFFLCFRLSIDMVQLKFSHGTLLKYLNFTASSTLVWIGCETQNISKFFLQVVVCMLTNLGTRRTKLPGCWIDNLDSKRYLCERFTNYNEALDLTCSLLLDHTELSI